MTFKKPEESAEGNGDVQSASKNVDDIYSKPSRRVTAKGPNIDNNEVVQAQDTFKEDDVAMQSQANRRQTSGGPKKADNAEAADAYEAAGDGDNEFLADITPNTPNGPNQTIHQRLLVYLIFLRKNMKQRRPGCQELEEIWGGDFSDRLNVGGIFGGCGYIVNESCCASKARKIQSSKQLNDITNEKKVVISVCILVFSFYVLIFSCSFSKNAQSLST